MTQTGGRLPVDGEYFTYPFKETLRNGQIAVFKLDQGQYTLDAFDKDKIVYMSPIKIEKENSGRCMLKANTNYVIIPSLEIQGKIGDFFLSIYFDQFLRDVNVKRVFHANDKQAGKEEVLPQFIPEEAEKLVNQTPIWKIQLVKESLKYMMTNEDEGFADSDWSEPLQSIQKTRAKSVGAKAVIQSQKVKQTKVKSQV